MLQYMYTTPTFIPEVLRLLTTYIGTTVLNNYETESNRLHSASLLLVGWFLQCDSTANPHSL